MVFACALLFILQIDSADAKLPCYNGNFGGVYVKCLKNQYNNNTHFFFAYYKDIIVNYGHQCNEDISLINYDTNNELVAMIIECGIGRNRYSLNIYNKTVFIVEPTSQDIPKRSDADTSTLEQLREFLAGRVTRTRPQQNASR
jgi:hypothetical protein